MTCLLLRFFKLSVVYVEVGHLEYYLFANELRLARGDFLARGVLYLVTQLLSHGVQ